jgi:hypothetical protein
MNDTAYRAARERGHPAATARSLSALVAAALESAESGREVEVRLRAALETDSAVLSLWEAGRLEITGSQAGSLPSVVRGRAPGKRTWCVRIS